MTVTVSPKPEARVQVPLLASSPRYDPAITTIYNTSIYLLATLDLMRRAEGVPKALAPNPLTRKPKPRWNQRNSCSTLKGTLKLQSLPQIENKKLDLKPCVQPSDFPNPKS